MVMPRQGADRLTGFATHYSEEAISLYHPLLTPTPPASRPRVAFPHHPHWKASRSAKLPGNGCPTCCAGAQADTWIAGNRTNSGPQHELFWGVPPDQARCCPQQSPQERQRPSTFYFLSSTPGRLILDRWKAEMVISSNAARVNRVLDLDEVVNVERVLDQYTASETRETRLITIGKPGHSVEIWTGFTGKVCPWPPKETGVPGTSSKRSSRRPRGDPYRPGSTALQQKTLISGLFSLNGPPSRRRARPMTGRPTSYYQPDDLFDHPPQPELRG